MLPSPCLLVRLAAAAALLPLPVTRQEPIVLHRLVANYLEDAVPARPVAQITAELRRCAAGGRQLHLVLSATGAGVDPVPGFEGRAGANLRTAQELHRLLRDERLQLVLRPESGEAQPGRLVEVRRATLPARRLRGDGTLDLHARTAAQWPVEVHFESPPLTRGAWQCDLLADGTPRLRVALALTVRGGRIAEVQSLGEDQRVPGRKP